MKSECRDSVCPVKITQCLDGIEHVASLLVQIIREATAQYCTYLEKGED